MNALFGLVHLDGQPVSPDRMAAVAERLSVRPRRPDGTTLSLPPPVVTIRIDGAVGMGLLTTHAAQTPAFPFRDPDSGVVISGVVSLYDRRALAAAVGPPAMPPPDAAHDGALLTAAYLRWGDTFPAHIHGDFALALWDSQARTLLLARDHLGCASSYYARRGETVAFASTMAGLLAAIDGLDELDPEWAANVIATNRTDPDRTPYVRVRRVLAGHVHRETANGSTRHRFWSLQAGAPAMLATDREYEEALREHLTRAVRVRMPESFHPVGCELSGGLDSSAVTALVAQAAQKCPRPLLSFCHVLHKDIQGAVWTTHDERDWANTLRSHAGLSHHEVVSGNGYGVLHSLREAITLYGAPADTQFGVFSDALYDRAAALDVQTLFSGFGGDEVVSSPATVVLDGWIARGDWRLVWDELRARGRGADRRSRWSLVRQVAARWAGRPRHGARAASGDIVARQRVAALPIRPDYAARWQLSDRAGAAWNALASANERADVRTVERHWTQHPALAERLEWCHIMAGARGLDYRYPLLDVPLLEWFHTVPDTQKWRAGWGRSLFRRAIAGLVPETIRWRDDKHGMSIPHAAGRFSADAQAFTELLSRLRTCPELDFLDFDAVEQQQASLLRTSPGIRTGPAPLRNLLGLMVYCDMRAEGWRP